MAASEKHAPGYLPNPDYTQDDWNEVSDNPEWTQEDFVAARPAAEALPELAATMRKSRGPQKTPTKELISLRVDHRVMEHYRATGSGWQGRMNAALLKAAGIID